MKKLSISVIIPVSTDIKIKQCLESIDEEVEIVVVLNNNPSSAVVKIVGSDARCKVLFIKEVGCNLAVVFNKGIDVATNQKVLLTNSDCSFPPGLIAKMCRSLESYDIVKARVEFAYTNSRQRLVAECRRLFHHVFDGGTKLFGPGLSFHKCIRNQLGGYYFDEKMGWGEDGELSNRIHEAKIKYCIVDDCLLHGAENVFHDLVVACRIGRGLRLSDKAKHIHLLKTLKADWKDLVNDPKKRFRTAYFEGGNILVLYLLVWKLTTYQGYYFGERR